MNRENIQLTAKIVASDTQDLYDVAKSKGIQMPHPALGIFKSILCEIEKPNANGIRLGEKATDAAVSTLVGTQINRNHLRTDNVLGHTIDAAINKDKEIEIVCIFFKDIYEGEYQDAMDLFNKGKLTMSFELSADVESQDKLADGTKRLNDYYFTGAGLLFGVKPACKKARVFEMATKKLQEKLSMERQSLIFANNQNTQKSIMEVLNQMADEVKKIEEVVTPSIDANDVNDNTDNMPECSPEDMNNWDMMDDYEPQVQEADKLTYEHRQTLSDSDFAVVVTVKNKVTGEPRKIRKFPINNAAHVRNALARLAQPKAQETLKSLGVSVEAVKNKILRRAKELNMTELLDRHNAENQEAKVTTCADCNSPMVDNMCSICQLKKAKEVAPVDEVKPNQPVVEPVPVVADAAVEPKVEEAKAEEVKVEEPKAEEAKAEESKAEVTYSQVQVDEIKATYEKEIAALKEQISVKDKEVETVKADLEETKKEKLEAAKKEELVVLATGHKKIDASEESGSAIGKLLKNRRANRK